MVLNPGLPAPADDPFTARYRSPFSPHMPLAAMLSESTVGIINQSIRDERQAHRLEQKCFHSSHRMPVPVSLRSAYSRQSARSEPGTPGSPPRTWANPYITCRLVAHTRFFRG